MAPMGPDKDIAALRARVSTLVEEEGALLNQAFELSRSGADRRHVDALFARVQAIQVERNTFKKQIGNLLGTHRLHAASEVWRDGVYDYRREVGGDSVRVRVSTGPIGLQVFMPGKPEAMRLESLKGTFDGPLAVDDDATHAEAAASPLATPARRRKKTP